MNEEIANVSAVRSEAETLALRCPVPKFFPDLKSSLLITWQAFRIQSFCAVLLLILCGMDAFEVKVPLLGLLEEAIVIGISYFVIKMTWRQLQEQDYKTIAPASAAVINFMFAVCFLYGLATILLSLLLVVPGVWWAARSSLAIVFVCIENASPIEAFKKSHQLVQGHFWLTVRYLVLGPLAVFLLILISIVIISGIVDAIANQSTALGRVITAVGIVAVYCLQLSVSSLLVRLYAYLKFPPKAASGPTQAIDPPQPRWNP
jgi:hypothetical protein